MMLPGTDLEEHARQRYEAAQLRMQAANGRLANPAPYNVLGSVAPASGDDDGW